MSKNENLNLADLDLKKLKLSEEDALALSYLTPGLSRRIQKQLLSQLSPSEARKLHRTLSSGTSDDPPPESQRFIRRSVDRLSSTLPRRFSTKKDDTFADVNTELDSSKESDCLKGYKSSLPVKSYDQRPHYEFSVRSSSIGSEPRGETKFNYKRPSLTKSMSVREPRSSVYSHGNVLNSPDSSVSESLSRNDDSSSYRKDTDSISEISSKAYSDSSASRPYSKYSSDSSYNRYASNKSYDSTQSFTPNSFDSNKTDIKKPSTSLRKISRFLRPDFFDTPKEESTYLKEKKEREMETQKVLKEIRDKRKTRLNMRRERSVSKEKQTLDGQSDNKSNEELHNDWNMKKNDVLMEENSLLLSNVSSSIKNLENSVQSMNDYVNVPAAQNCINGKSSAGVLHDYVNVAAADGSMPIVKKDRLSKLARPKSYPTENTEKPAKISPEKESKLSKIRKGFVRQPSKEKDKTKEDKNETNKNEAEKGHKNKLLQSIEKKLEKFRLNTSASSKDPDEIKALQDKKSTVESAIKRLREQSLPRNLEPCTESGLIKRAVSVEDLTGNKPLQASRKSVTKILGLFKKYEEQEDKKKEKVVKKPKTKENGKATEGKSVKTKKESDKKATESVILSNNIDAAEPNKASSIEINDTSNKVNQTLPNDSSQSNETNADKKSERPRSLLLDKMRQFQTAYNGARSDSSVIVNDKESKVKSKLPVNSFRRSLNLDNLPEPPKFYKNPSKTNVHDPDKTPSVEQPQQPRPDRRNLKLDLIKISPKCTVDTKPPTPSTSSDQAENRNSLTTTDDSSTFLSPGDDNMSDSWSICSDLHPHDLHSPVSPNGHIYSGDENESVIDRIRRKSFYTRFNEKKRPRRTSTTTRNYKDYKDLDFYKTSEKNSSLERRSYDYRTPTLRRSSYAVQEPAKGKSDYKSYARSSLMNDYVNVPNRYQTYSSKIGRPATTLYSDSEDQNALDDILSTARSRKYSTHIQPSRLGSRTSVSPVSEQCCYIDKSSVPIVSTLSASSTSEPV